MGDKPLHFEQTAPLGAIRHPRRGEPVYLSLSTPRWLLRRALIGVAATPLLVGRAAAQTSGGSVCTTGFFSNAIPFIIGTAATLLVAAAVSALMLGGAGEAVAQSSQKKQQFGRMQKAGVVGPLKAFAGIAVIGVLLTWTSVPIPTGCIPGL